jgi:hypothetical protein
MNFIPMPSPLPDMEVWAARSHGYSFVISLEKTQPPDPEWNGYTASWKNTNIDTRPFGKQPANRIDGGPWKTFAEAERACEQVLKQLKAAN